jgi:hypothetical protein
MCGYGQAPHQSPQSLKGRELAAMTERPAAAIAGNCPQTIKDSRPPITEQIELSSCVRCRLDFRPKQHLLLYNLPMLWLQVTSGQDRGRHVCKIPSQIR